MVRSAISVEEKLSVGRLSSWRTQLPDEVTVAVMKASLIDGMRQKASMRTASAQLVVDRMQPHMADAAVQRAGLEKLRHIATRDAVAVTAAGGAHAVVAAMRAHPANAPMQRCGCSIAALNACAGAMLASGGPEAVLEAMQLHTGDDGVQSSANAALSSFMRHSEEASPRLLAAGGAKLVVEGMRVHLAHSSTQIGGCNTLRHLAADKAACRQAVRDAGGVEAVMAAMRAHAASLDVQRAGCDALSSIACGDEACKQDVLRHGGPAAAVAALTVAARLKADVRVGVSGCVALGLMASGKGTLSRSEAQCKGSAVGAGAAEAVVVLMRLHALERALQREACTALCALASGDEACKRAVVEAGGAEVLVAALAAHPGDIVLQRECCDALRHVTVVDPLTVLQLGGATALVATLRTHSADEDIQRDGCKAVWSLAEADPIRCKRAVLAAGGLALLVGRQERPGWKALFAGASSRWDLLEQRPEGVEPSLGLVREPEGRRWRPVGGD